MCFCFVFILTFASVLIAGQSEQSEVSLLVSFVSVVGLSEVNALRSPVFIVTENSVGSRDSYPGSKPLESNARGGN